MDTTPRFVDQGDRAWKHPGMKRFKFSRQNPSEVLYMVAPDRAAAEAFYRSTRPVSLVPPENLTVTELPD